MGQIKVISTPIKDLYVIEPTFHGDDRGYFVETYNQQDMAEAGLNIVFVQDNQSMSKRGVLRGLHYQKHYPQTKLARVISGVVYDVAVDLRHNSPTFRQWHGEILSAENHRQLLIPAGFAHGFLVLSDEAEFCYKVSDFYHPGDEGGILWNDPDLGVHWPGVKETPTGYAMEDGTPILLSDKDKHQTRFRDAFEF